MQQGLSTSVVPLRWTGVRQGKRSRASPAQFLHIGVCERHRELESLPLRPSQDNPATTSRKILGYMRVLSCSSTLIAISVSKQSILSGSYQFGGLPFNGCNYCLSHVRPSVIASPLASRAPLYTADLLEHVFATESPDAQIPPLPS